MLWASRSETRDKPCTRQLDRGHVQWKEERDQHGLFLAQKHPGQKWQLNA